MSKRAAEETPRSRLKRAKKAAEDAQDLQAVKSPDDPELYLHEVEQLQEAYYLESKGAADEQKGCGDLVLAKARVKVLRYVDCLLLDLGVRLQVEMRRFESPLVQDMVLQDMTAAEAELQPLETHHVAAGRFWALLDRFLFQSQVHVSCWKGDHKQTDLYPHLVHSIKVDCDFAACIKDHEYCPGTS